MKNLTWQNPELLGFAACHKQELFVAQVLINKVKSKCCGIKVIIWNNLINFAKRIDYGTSNKHRRLAE